MIAKPIFVIRMSYNHIQELSKFGKEEELRTYLSDYHVLFAPGETDTPIFECYNPNDLPEDVRETTLKQLNKIIKEKL